MNQIVFARISLPMTVLTFLRTHDSWLAYWNWSIASTSVDHCEFCNSRMVEHCKMKGSKLDRVIFLWTLLASKCINLYLHLCKFFFSMPVLFMCFFNRKSSMNVISLHCWSGSMTSPKISRLLLKLQGCWMSNGSQLFHFDELFKKPIEFRS